MLREDWQSVSAAIAATLCRKHDIDYMELHSIGPEKKDGFSSRKKGRAIHFHVCESECNV